MFTLNKLQVKLAKPLITSKNKKFLRISIGSTAIKTDNPGKFVNEKSLEWSESITLPLFFNRQFQFEIYQKHEFGYDQREFKQLLQGNFEIISPNETWNTWEIFTPSRQKVGFLSAEISIPSQFKNSSSSIKKSKPTNQPQFMNQSYVEEQTGHKSIINNKSDATNHNKSVHKEYQPMRGSDKVLRVASMVAKITGIKLKKGYVIITIGDRKVQTKPVRSRADELVFIESEEIQYFPTDTDATFQIYSVTPQKQSELVGAGTLQLLVPKPPRTLGLMKDGYERGEMLIDSKIQERKKGKDNYSKIFKYDNLALEQSRKQVSQSVNYTRLEDFGIRNNSRVHYYNLQSSRSSLSPKNKKSVLNSNKNIPFPKQKRFMIYQDKHNQRISYLKDRSFELKDPISGNFYRGASIGKGDKTDFTSERKSVPGVGNYRLPSIWDRY